MTELFGIIAGILLLAALVLLPFMVMLVLGTFMWLLFDMDGVEEYRKNIE